jgi:hypothetical protein
VYLGKQRKRAQDHRRGDAPGEGHIRVIGFIVTGVFEVEGMF